MSIVEKWAYFDTIVPMIITRHGSYFVKLQSGDTVVAVNPISKESKEKTQKFGADVAVISLNEKDWNGADEVAFGNKTPFVVKGPGEYEVSGIFVQGYGIQSSYGGDEHINTVYVLNFESIKIGVLGALQSYESNKEVISAIDSVDILFVPISKETLSPSDAYKITVSLEPKLIIPLGDESMVKQFMKEAGKSDAEKLDKITIRKKELEGKEGEIIILE